MRADPEDEKKSRNLSLWLSALPPCMEAPQSYRRYGCGSKPMVPFWVGAPPVLVYFSGDWDVLWGYGLLNHGHIYRKHPSQLLQPMQCQHRFEARIMFFRKSSGSMLRLVLSQFTVGMLVRHALRFSVQC